MIGNSGRKVTRITALDPAGPLFDNIFVSEDDRLSKDDADLVVVLHTDAGKFGFGSSCGHIDIYPNGGRAPQPGCRDSKIFIIKLPGMSLIKNLLLAFCSHHRSYLYYIEAVKNQTLEATQCSSYVFYLMGVCPENKKIDVGGDISLGDSGNYYLKTNSDEPFAIKT